MLSERLPASGGQIPLDKMTIGRRNNLIITATVFVVLIMTAAAFFIFKTNEPPKKEGGIQLVFAADSGQHPAIGIDKFTNIRKYTKFILTNDSSSNIETLELARQKLNSIKQNQDTINGVHIILGDNTPYHFFIKAVDICREKHPACFAPNKNDIFALYINVPPRPGKKTK